MLLDRGIILLLDLGVCAIIYLSQENLLCYRVMQLLKVLRNVQVYYAMPKWVMQCPEELAYIEFTM